MRFTAYRKTLRLLLLLCLTFMQFVTAQAQEGDTLDLRLVRRFGFQAGLQIQGAFSVRASGPDSLALVEFYIDGELISADEEAPFRMEFSTSEFSSGEHRLWAIGRTEGGGQVQSVERRLIFITAEEGFGTAINYLVPVLVVIAAVSVISTLALMRSGRHATFQPGEYGSAGGAVCTRCGLPFSRHLLAPNLVLGKLERCPHCGHWAIVPRAPDKVLKEAEASYAADARDGFYAASESDDEMKQRIEDSRFDS